MGIPGTRRVKANRIISDSEDESSVTTSRSGVGKHGSNDDMYKGTQEEMYKAPQEEMKMSQFTDEEEESSSSAHGNSFTVANSAATANSTTTTLSRTSTEKNLTSQPHAISIAPAPIKKRTIEQVAPDAKDTAIAVFQARIAELEKVIAVQARNVRRRKEGPTVGELEQAQKNILSASSERMACTCICITSPSYLYSQLTALMFTQRYAEVLQLKLEAKSCINTKEGHSIVRGDSMGTTTD